MEPNQENTVLRVSSCALTPSGDEPCGYLHAQTSDSLEENLGLTPLPFASTEQNQQNSTTLLACDWSVS